jgi:transcription elongation factor Elf1
MKTTLADYKKYPHTCIHCGANEISTLTSDYYPDHLVIETGCDACGATWEEEYSIDLVSVRYYDEATIEESYLEKGEQ